MKKALMILAASAAALSAAPATISAKAKLTPAEELDKLLAGRVAGKPQTCISLSDSRDMRVIDKTAIVYGWGNTIWVNRTNDPASLDSDDILVSRVWGASLCSLDLLQQHDRSGGFWRGFVSLGDFVPYRKAS